MYVRRAKALRKKNGRRERGNEGERDEQHDGGCLWPVQCVVYYTVVFPFLPILICFQPYNLPAQGVLPGNIWRLMI